MADDLVKRLRADELPGDRQRQIEARIELWKILQEAADRIEQLEKGFRDILKSNDDALIISVIAKACLHGFIDAQGRYCYVPFSALEEKKDD